MSQTDIETLRSGYEAFSRGDWDTPTRFAHPEFELKTAGRTPNPGTYRGTEAVRQFFEDLFSPFEEITIEPEEFFQRGDRIAVYLRVQLRPTGSNAVVENRIGHLWTMREGRAVRLEVFPRREEALEAAGLSE